MNNRITHAGVIDKISQQCITVRIIQTAACAGCKVSGQCNASESKEKLIDVYGQNDQQRNVGDHVVVSADIGTGYRAVAWGFGIPLVVMVLSLFVVRLWTDNDALAALVGIVALLPYYILLYLLRDKIRSRFTFKID